MGKSIFWQFGCSLLVLALFWVLLLSIAGFFYLIFSLTKWHPQAVADFLNSYGQVEILINIVLGLSWTLPIIAFFEAPKFMDWLKAR